MEKQLLQVAERTAQKRGLNVFELIKKINSKNTTLNNNEIATIFEISQKSILTTPDMLEYYLGMNAKVIRWVLATKQEQYKQAA